MLKMLQDTADRNRLQPTDNRATVTFEPSKLWQLLDSRLTLPSPEMGDSVMSNSEDSSSPTITARVPTNLIHPLLEREPEQAPQNGAAESTINLAALQSWPYAAEDIFSSS